MLINSSFTLSGNGMRDLSEQVSLDAFRNLYRVDMGVVATLTSYTDDESENDIILPNSSIAGPYSCVTSIDVANVIINVRSMLFYN